MPNNMGKRFHLGLAALLLPALIACTGTPAGQAGIDWQEGEMLAVGFLGYYDSFGAFEASPSYVQLTKDFPEIVEAAKVECGIGRQIYLVIPRDPMASLAVNEDGEYVTDENRRVFYRSEEGKPVLLLNNWYGENSLISIVDNDGHAALYTPAINIQGALVVPGDGSVHDISLPMPEPMEGYTFFDYGTDFDNNDLGIRVRLQGGQPVLTCSAAPLTNIGYNEDSIVLADGDNPFSGINGRCKGVFLGTIGQDYNPVACVVMENGDVKMASIIYAMQHGGPDLSSALPGFKDVTGFESGGGGGWEDEETGETIYEYETIYALDARGGRTEIPYFADYGTYRSLNDHHTYEAIVTPDWNYALFCYDVEDYSLCEAYYGSFFEKEWGESERKFEFNRRYRQFHSAGSKDAFDADFDYDYTPVSGTFTTTEEVLTYKVALSGSDAFPSGQVFSDERLLFNEEEYEDEDEYY